MQQFQLNLDSNTEKPIHTLYRNFSHDNANVRVTFLPVQKQQDDHNCGLFTVAFAPQILDGKSPTDSFSCPSTSPSSYLLPRKRSFDAFSKNLNQKRK